jgi:hypothetical protein
MLGVQNLDFLYVRIYTTTNVQKLNPNAIGYVYLETWKLGCEKKPNGQALIMRPTRFNMCVGYSSTRSIS